MTPQEQMILLITAAQQLFAAAPQPLRTDVGLFYRQVFKNSKLRYFDFEIGAGAGKKIKLRLVEQNPNKEYSPGQLSKYAALARQGHLIAWLIDRTNNTYLGSMQNGAWEPSQPRAYTKPATTTTTAPASQTVVREVDPTTNLELDSLPDVEDDIPEFVLSNYPDPEEAMDDFDTFIQNGLGQ